MWHCAREEECSDGRSCLPWPLSLALLSPARELGRGSWSFEDTHPSHIPPNTTVFHGPSSC